jgi:hypothetical protein
MELRSTLDGEPLGPCRRLNAATGRAAARGTGHEATPPRPRAETTNQTGLTMNDQNSTRTIQEILDIRLRAAQLRVMERASAAAKLQEQIRTVIVPGDLEQELANALHAKQLAEDALALVHREIDAQKGAGEPVPYDSASGFGTRRYAAVLMLDDPELTPEHALAQAERDEHARFDEHYARVHGDDDLDEDDELDDEA